MTKNITKIVNETESLDLILGTKPNDSNMIYNLDDLLAPTEIIIL